LAEEEFELLKTVRKGVGELKRRVLVTSEKVSEFETVFFIFLTFIVGLVTNDGSSTTPLVLSVISITYLHALVIETAAFRESFDQKVRLPLDTLNCEVKPCIVAGRIALLIEADFETVDPNQLDLSDMP
jgi:hypothetical protein